MNRTALVGAVTACLFSISVEPALATPQMFTKAKASGFPAQNCQYCHASKLPKKEEFKPQDLNDRGKWLMTEKDKQKATDINLDWLKTYPGSKEQK
jgi:hypothetical protein